MKELYGEMVEIGLNLVEGEFKNIEIGDLTEILENIFLADLSLLIEFEKMNDYDKFDFVVDNIIEKIYPEYYS